MLLNFIEANGGIESVYNQLKKKEKSGKRKAPPSISHPNESLYTMANRPLRMNSLEKYFE